METRGLPAGAEPTFIVSISWEQFSLEPGLRHRVILVVVSNSTPCRGGKSRGY